MVDVGGPIGAFGPPLMAQSRLGRSETQSSTQLINPYSPEPIKKRHRNEKKKAQRRKIFHFQCGCSIFHTNGCIEPHPLAREDAVRGLLRHFEEPDVVQSSRHVHAGESGRIQDRMHVQLQPPESTRSPNVQCDNVYMADLQWSQSLTESVFTQLIACKMTTTLSSFGIISPRDVGGPIGAFGPPLMAQSRLGRSETQSSTQSINPYSPEPIKKRHRNEKKKAQRRKIFHFQCGCSIFHTNGCIEPHPLAREDAVRGLLRHFEEPDVVQSIRHVHAGESGRIQDRMHVQLQPPESTRSPDVQCDNVYMADLQWSQSLTESVFTQLIARKMTTTLSSFGIISPVNYCLTLTIVLDKISYYVKE
ncbi:unnamed protein product [Camellia sinensis]